MTMGEMKRNPQFLPLAKALIQEVKNIAQACQIQNLEHFEEEALSALDLMSENGKSSMLQDILAHRKTEVDIFAGEIIKRGKKLGIETPYNKTIYDLIKIIELK
jgi:2-dehydropantoate 2-reductase